MWTIGLVSSGYVTYRDVLSYRSSVFKVQFSHSVDNNCVARSSIKSLFRPAYAFLISYYASKDASHEWPVEGKLKIIESWRKKQNPRPTELQVECSTTVLQLRPADNILQTHAMKLVYKRDRDTYFPKLLNSSQAFPWSETCYLKWAMARFLVTLEVQFFSKCVKGCLTSN